ncbi:excalibur calcium-binding domain-containing protein [Arthrobacter pascens]|uniref:excalibur calcium-binding domain-containing protein n=1 Tax=Arthrobacter pascens TaxID=1677 RepID=UPI00196B282D|nr:excalibur calcium-binding domain-containing protein [Arthrobacter pascens]MBN3496401.1 excalibur calcium-binding domain-containing protein [Arthrobacter pascens]
MKKTLILVVLAGLMLTGCGGKQEAAQPAESATAVAVAEETATVPGVVGLTLDVATEQLEDLGLEVEAEDTVDGKSIIVKKNWQVVSQDPTDGAQVAKGSTVHLGVKNLDTIAAEKAAAEKAAADKVAAEKAAAVKAAAAKAAADKAAADKVAADKAAADTAAADKVAADAAAAAEKLAAEQAAQQAVPQAPVQQAAPPAPASAYYANCAAAKAAGAAPLYAGQAGYSTSLDRDRDGVACES